ncbi:LysR family transcriptional regulator [Paraperlucidibaca wandonensis]|uniref:LysR family transcriptional regulator n=1 Tax=Paraperlucidibaca wandonensis TaxID=1268273 RepID=A0ABW3HGI0_9GAMM
MRFRLDYIETFITVMEAGSLSAAGLRMDLSKSVISKRISDLENSLNTQLLSRSTRGVHATDKGQEFYARARQLVQQLDDVVEATLDDNASLSGQIKIAAPMSFGTMHLGAMLFDFLKLHPSLELALTLDDKKIDIEGSGFDIAIRVTQMKDSTLIARKLALSKRVVCCSPSYSAMHGLPISVDDLSNHKCIGYTNLYSGQLWQFEPLEQAGQVRSIPLKAHYVFNNGESMRDAAIAGLGLCLIPLFIASEALADGRLINAMPNDSPTVDTIYAMYPQCRHQPRKVRAVIDYLAAKFAGISAWEASCQ